MRKYQDEFKREALRLAEKEGMTIARVERDLGITRGLLYKWRDAMQPKGSDNVLKTATKPTTGKRAAADQIRRLQERLAIVTDERDIAMEERDILKKACQFFAQETPR